MDVPGLKPTGIELRHFRYFVAVAEELHFGKAAARLNIVQPALTAQIKSLEKMLGVELLARSNRRVELTDAGRELLRESYVALSQFGNAIETVKDFGRGATGTLRLGYGANAALAGILPSSIRRFRSLWPSVKVTLTEMPSSEVSEALLRNEIDVGYAATTGVEPKKVASRNVGEWPWLLAVADFHHLASMRTVRVADVSGESIAVYAEPNGRSSVVGILASLPELVPGHVYRASHMTSMMTYVSSGLGVAFIPSPIVSLNFPGLVYSEIEDPIPKLQMKLVWRDGDGDRIPTVRNYLRCAERY